MTHLDTRVLIIGGGVTGTGIARDLALRGVDCILVESKDINAGASGANHGLLHSGARYVASDPQAARECCEENVLLKQMAPHCIEDTGGLFVAVEGDDERYISDFPDLCRQSGIPVKTLSVTEAREQEPSLSSRTIAAYAVPDASVDPFKLSLANLGDAMNHGAQVFLQTGVTGFRVETGKIVQTQLIDGKTGKEIDITADQVINAAGAWAGDVAALAGQTVHLLYSKGSLLITDVRITDRVINRLHQSSDADILVPGGTVSILGTTSIRIKDLHEIRPTIEEIDYIIDTAAGMIPQLHKQRYIRAYAGVRPLVGTGDAARDDRAVTRGYALIDHEPGGISNLTSVIGGKLTTFRAMAEKTVDQVCRKLGVSAACRTDNRSLPETDACRWTVPGHSSREWIKGHAPEDQLLCECEMVSKQVVDGILQSIHRQNGRPDIKAIGLRSRVGKGVCQGAFCGVRVAAYMYEKGYLDTEKGLEYLKDFLGGRWKGIRPVLWNTTLVQEELQEAMHCGFFGLEFEGDDHG